EREPEVYGDRGDRDAGRDAVDKAGADRRVQDLDGRRRRKWQARRRLVGRGLHHSSTGAGAFFFTRSGTSSVPFERFASWPHAASMSSPRGRRRYVKRPRRLHSFWNASITAGAGRWYGASGCGF